MDITNIIQEDIVTVYLDDTISDVAEVLQDEHVGSVVVLDAHDEILGVVTDRDLVVYGRNFIDSLEHTTINEILSTDVFSVGPDVSVAELTARMREVGVRRVPVVENGELRGIVTLDDLIVLLADELDSQPLRDLAAVIESESPPKSDD
ncbi:cyclic nucleotide-binding/CBS domain-containing protein [Natronomonas sp.]|uniref:CBS domain-containing protein n=1 Tax=Natronomonas sp. TaxID=2184060 RepID=UPI003975F446